MNIESLLNPVWDNTVTRVVDRDSPPATRPRSPTSTTAQPRLKTQKLAKDAPVFRKGRPKGDVQFPPHEAGHNVELLTQHMKFQVFPRGEIASYVHRIPYSSDKKTFLEKTGRDAFEVFQYTFKLPDEDKEYTVMWDYNIGLVRVTTFFKCCKYSKTTPARVLNLNPGLRDISHSITGGALAAQGYWMPFKAAKAVAATFCYNIRYALTPLFSEDFVDLCIHPSDRNFGSFRIDDDIIRQCAVETQSWLTRGDARRTPTPSLYSSPEPSALETYLTPKPASLYGPFRFKKLKPKILKATESESGYGTDSDFASDKLAGSPEVSPKTTIPEWTTVNPKASREETTAIEGLQMLSCSPIQRSTDFAMGSVVEVQRKSKRALGDTDDEYAGDESTIGEDDSPKTANKTNNALRATESRAAFWLMQLRMGDSKHRAKRARRASIN